MIDNINDFLDDENEQNFDGLNDVIELLKKHSIYNYKLIGNKLKFVVVGNIKFKITNNENNYRIVVAKDNVIPFMDNSIDSLKEMLNIINRWILIYRRSYTDPEEHTIDGD